MKTHFTAVIANTVERGINWLRFEIWYLANLVPSDLNCINSSDEIKLCIKTMMGLIRSVAFAVQEISYKFFPMDIF